MQLPLWGLLWTRRFLGLLTLVAPLRGSLGDCPLPSNPTGTKRKEFAGVEYFPVGTVIQYDCDDGYKRVPGTKNAVRCGDNSQWSQPEEFCKQSCIQPPVIRDATLQVEFRRLQYFPAGAKVRYDCNAGYIHIPGTLNSVHCEKDFQWSYPEKFCAGACLSPPNPMGAKLKEQYAHFTIFLVHMEIAYDCIKGYVSVPGIRNSVKCQPNLKWSQPAVFCRRSCPSPPNVRGAKLQGNFAGVEYFPLGMVLTYECDGQYKRVPHTKNSITCGNNSQWLQLEVFCKESCPLPPSLRNAKLKEEFVGLEFFPIGGVVKYDCEEGYKRPPGSENSVRCGDNLQWSQRETFCQVSCDLPPNLRDAKLRREFEGLEYFPPGTVVKYDCNRGLKHIPGTENSARCGDGLEWSQPEGFCKVVKCDDPVIENGVKLTGFSDTHIYGNNIALECNIGYFMIGSYMIQCGENSMWNPKVPSCEKITAKLCGAPLVPSGSVRPLEAQYELGTYVVIECNPQYSFPDETMEMTTICQGHNLWKPPAQPCIFRTSPDTSELIIHNGRIVHGKKEKYKPGDNVTIKCNAGYTLQGPSVVRYIGGKKWSPSIPYCSLSFFFILLIAGM